MAETEPQAELPRIGGQGEGESDKDYCLRMVRQHSRLNDTVFERLFAARPGDFRDLAARCLAVTTGLANDDPATYERFAKAWRECLPDTGLRREPPEVP